MFSEEILSLAHEVLTLCRNQGLRICIAESCTGGLIASALTEIPGSSDVFERGFVAYSNTSKKALLNISEDLLQKYGAVSSEVAIAMAEGALNNSEADISLSITGIAGPGGATASKPIGLVFIALAKKEKRSNSYRQFNFKGDRSAIRFQAVKEAFTFLLLETANHKAS